MSFSNVEGSEDVHDFLQRIKEIGKQRNQEDEERDKRLEEAIIQGRKERQARRAERARSISPTKTSPAENLLRNRYSVPQNLSFSEFPQLCAKSSGGELQQKIAADFESISSSSEIPISRDAQRTPPISGMREKEDLSSSPGAAILRSPTLSWNRKNSSRASISLANRQNSLTTTKIVTKFQDTPLDLTHAHLGSQSCSQEPIVQKPNCSDSLRDHQAESLDLDSPASDYPGCDNHRCSDHESALSIKMSNTKYGELPYEQKKNEIKDHPVSLSKDFSDNKDLKSSPTNSSSRGGVNDSPTPSIVPQKTQSPPESKLNNRNLALFATSRCISPEKFNQSSPTKGMGGFVQSAMMRRNDSVNKKRWSGNNSPNINKTKSVPNIVLASTNSNPCGPKPETELNLSNISYTSLDRSIVTHDRPLSSASMRSDLITSSKRSSIENQISSDGRAGNVQRIRSVSPSSNDPNQQEETPPISPSRTMDRRRWSPTKSSWLEAVLNKPDLFKQRPKTIQPPQQPAWMSEISKARQRPQKDTSRSSSLTPKHEVNIGGLMRSRPTGSPVPVVNFPGALNPGFAAGTNKNASGGNIISSRPESRINVTNLSSSPYNMTPTLHSKPKADELPKKDYRANLKPRKPPLGSGNTIEPDLKNVFVQLRPTKTQSYVAPDELKNNITRGKAALNVTGGPRKSEQKDEFKEAILRKKEDFRKAQFEGKGISRTSSGTQSTTLPEALVKQRALSRSDSVYSEFPINIEMKSCFQSTSHSRTASVPGSIRPQTNEFVKITDKVSPDLSRLLSQETKVQISHKRQSYSVNPVFENNFSKSKFQEHSPKLIHLTKERDRGPRRKPPSINQASNSSERLVSVERIFNEAIDSSDVKFSSEVMLKSAIAAKVGPESSLAVIHPSTSQSENAQELESAKYKVDTSLTPPNEIYPLEKVALAQLPEASKTESHNDDEPIEGQFSEKFPLDQSRPNIVNLAHSTLTFSQKSKVPESPTLIDVKQSDQKQSPQISSLIRKTDERSYQESIAVEETPAHLDISSPATCVKINSGIQSNHGNTSLSSLNYTDSSGTKPDELISKITHNVPHIITSPTENLIEPTALNITQLSSTPETSDCFTALTRFFDRTRPPKNFDFDTLNLLSSNLEEDFKTTSLQVDVFLYSSDGNKKNVPSNQERIFFEENTYICVHKHKNINGKTLNEVFLWVGDEISTSLLKVIEDNARIESKVMGSDLLTIRQGKETSQFFVALGGFIIVQRGSSNKYNSLAPRILCARNYYGHIAFDEVDFSSESLCSGFSYLISTNCGKCYLWKGRGTSVEELTCAKLVGMDFGLTGEIEEVEEGKEPLEFLQIFGDNVQMPESADYWELKPKFSRYCARLFVADESSKEKISEIKHFNQQDLNEHQKIYIVDVFFEIYILIGSEAQSQYSAFHNALIFVQEYSILAAGMEERPHVPPIKVILSGITRDLKAVFRKWTNSHSPSHQYQTENPLLMLPLTEVLEAVRD